MKMFMEYWWKDTDWLKQKYSQNNLSQYHFEGHCQRETEESEEHGRSDTLTLWRRNYFFLILAHPVYKM